MKARYHGHRDKNHLPIARALERAGYSVQDTSGVAGFVDMIVSATPDRTAIIEVKRADRGRITIRTLETLAQWRGYAALLATEEQALAFMANPKRHAITDRQRGKMLLLARQMSQQGQTELTWNVFQKAMEEIT